jgi:hypothetical protein
LAIATANRMTRETERQHGPQHTTEHGWIVVDATTGKRYTRDGKELLPEGVPGTTRAVEKSLWDAWARGEHLSPERMAFMESVDTFLDVPGNRVQLVRGGKVVRTIVSDGKALQDDSP